MQHDRDLVVKKNAHPTLKNYHILTGKADFNNYNDGKHHGREVGGGMTRH